MKKLSNFMKKQKLIFNILNQYFLKFIKFNTSIKIVDKKDYYIIYFLDKEFYYNNLDEIDSIFNNLNNIYADKLFSISKDIVYGYIYNFYVNYKDFENDVKRGLCKDLTYRFFKPYKKLYYNSRINLANSFNFENNYVNKITNSKFYNLELNNDVCVNINKKDCTLINIENLGDSNGNLTAA